MPFKTQQKCRQKNYHHISKRIIHHTKSSRKTLMRSPNCTASSPVFPLFLPPSIALVLFLLLPPAHSRALSLSFPHFLSPCLSFSPLSPRPVCMNNVLPFVMRARGGKTRWSVRPLRALTLKMNDSLPECQSSSDWHQADNTSYTPLHKPWRLPYQTPPTISPLLSLSPRTPAECTPPRFLFHWRYSVPYRTPRALHAHLRFISGGARWPPIGIKRDLHSAAARTSWFASRVARRKVKETYYLYTRNENICHLVKSQMYV